MFYTVPKIQRSRGLTRLLSPHWIKRASAAEGVTVDTLLHSAQLGTLAHFSILLAAVGLFEAGVTGVAMSSSWPITGLLLWGGLLALSARMMVNSIGTSFIKHVGQPVERRAIIHAWILIAQFVLIWSTPILHVLHEPAALPTSLAILLGCIAMATALPIAIERFAAAIWVAVGAAMLMLACFTGHAELPLATKLAAGGFIILVSVTVAALAGAAFSQIREASADYERAYERELLIKEYEEQSTGGLWQIDTQNLLTYVSPSVAVTLGVSRAQLVGNSLPMVLGGHAEIGAALINRTAFNNAVAEIATRTGTRWVALSGDPVFDDNGNYRGFRGTAIDVTEARNSQERMRHLASHDVLTRLPNRHSMRALIERALADAQAASCPCALLYIDLDGFKPVNDTFGHLRGDHVLKEVAQRLSEEAGSGATVGRLGGDEFVILVNDGQSREIITDLARRVIARVSEPYEVESVHVRIGASVGVAFGPLDADTEDELFRKADLALYDAKDSGRGTVRFFESHLDTNAQERVLLEADLRQALARNELELFYQPVVSAATKAIVGFEALLRWKHPVRGYVSPAVFIPLAEESGLIGDIGAWALKTACLNAAAWPEKITVAVNLSALQLNMRSLTTTVRDALNRARLPAGRLELEVTESVFLGDSTLALEVLGQLRAIGCHIALDDFGTGYSSLGYLNKTVFHKLKIDGSFVRAAKTDKEMIAIIQAVITLARSFRMTVTAEGVEGQDDYERMRDLGCDLIQGYLFGRPVPYARATELVCLGQKNTVNAAA